jgi:hypothetical protein
MAITRMRRGKYLSPPDLIRLGITLAIAYLASVPYTFYVPMIALPWSTRERSSN